MSDTNVLERPVIEQQLPAKHIEIRLINAPETYLLGSRGSFKTSRGIALYVAEMVHEMPRSTGVGVALSFEHLDANTIDPLLSGLQDLGFSDGEHFVLNKRPPDHWPRPYLRAANNKYDRSMTWYNGTEVKFLSLARKASGNGVSAQWGFFDEVKFMDPEDLKEIFPIFRGNKEHFGHLSAYLSKFFATDKLADPAQIEWLLDKRKLVDQARIDVIIPLQLKLNELRAEYLASGINKRTKLKVAIHRLEKTLTLLRKNLVYVAEINCYDVLPFHGQDWLDSAFRNASSDRVRKVAYENLDPDRPTEVFYPAYNEAVHTYESDRDIDINKPLIISPDYQHSVAPIPISQVAPLPGKERASLNYVDEVWTLYPEGLRAAVKKFAERHKYHGDKTVYYVYDHTAIGKRTDADDYKTIVTDELTKHGWYVVEVDTGQAPTHYQKYLDTIDWMEHTNEEDLEIRINKKRCPFLVASIVGAGAKTSQGETKKNKEFENTTKYPSVDQRKTTHFSDAFDMTNQGVLKLKLITEVFDSVGFGFR